MVEMPDQQVLAARLKDLFININKVKIGSQSAKDETSRQKVTSYDNIQTRVAGLLEQPQKLYRMAEVGSHCDSSDCWIVLWDRVYNVTTFLSEHPGGEDILLENAGRDATIPFSDMGHSQDAKDMLTQYCIGILAEEDRIGSIKRKRYDTY